MKEALIIFYKNPVAGHVKTRLAKTIGDEKAMQVYRLLVKHTQSAVETLAADKLIYYSELVVEDDNWQVPGYQKRLQSGDDLGERMLRSFSEQFNRGYSRVCIIGCDCPSITPGIIREAYAQLMNHDVVIGPAHDGGYYLLALNNIHQQLFEDIRWSTPAVLNETIARCRSSNLRYALLPVLHDVDEEKDLAHLQPQLI